MIQKHLTAYCDGCAIDVPLVSQTLKEAAQELANNGWTVDTDKHIYCGKCSKERQILASLE